MQFSELAEHLPAEIWRGAAQAWQCDEMAHLNASFYVAFADEGLAALEAELGIFPTAGWRPVCHHLRFAREIPAGASLHMRGGVLAVSDQGCDILQALVNTQTNDICAAIMTRLHYVDHRAPGRGGDLTKRAAPLMAAAPPDLYAQAVPDRSAAPAPDLAFAQKLGMTRSALGQFLPKEKRFDSNLIAADAFISRVADATRRLSRLFEQAAHQHDPDKPKLGSAALECRLDYFKWPAVGDRFVIYSGYSEIGEKSSRRVVHWMFDADSGAPLSAVHTLEVNFDLNARKARQAPPEVRAQLAPYIVEALRPQP